MHLSQQYKLKQWSVALLFLLPNIAAFLIFVLGPIVFSFYMSLSEWTLVRPPVFVGLENFRTLLHDKYFWQYLGNTAFLLIGLPLEMAGALVLALALNRPLKGRVLLRTVAFLPSVCSPVALALMWKTLLNRDSGVVNALLGEIGIAKIDWLGSIALAKPSMIMIGFWAGVGGVTMILYLAALQAVDAQFYEAASIDGANGWQTFWHITWPMISPTTWFILITGVIGGFQAGFDLAYILTAGGPLGATTTLVYYIYTTGFNYMKMGYASSVAWAVFAIISIVTVLNWRFGEGKVFYG